MKFFLFPLKRQLCFPLVIMGLFAPISWFANHPLDLPFAPKYISSQVTKLAPQYQAEIGKAQLYWDKRTFRPVLLLQDIQIQQQGKKEVSLEKATISFNLEGLMSFPPRPPIEIYLDNIHIDLNSIYQAYPSPSEITHSENTNIEEALIYMDKLKHLPAASIVLRDAVVKYGGHEFQLYRVKIVPGKITKLQLSKTQETQDLDLKIDWNNKGQVSVKGKIHEKTKVNVVADYGGKGIEFTISIDAIEARDLLRIWPQFIAEGTRSWLDDNLLSGTITHSRLKIDTAFAGEPEHLQVKNVTADIAIENATMSYMEDAPRIEHLNASIMIINDKIGITASNALLHGVPLQNLSAEIIDIAGDNAELTIHSKINSSLMPIIDIALAHAKNHTFNLRDIKGMAETTVDLVIPLMASNPNKIDITSKLTEVAADNIQDGHSISHGDLVASYQNGSLTIKGKALIDNVLQAKITYLLPDEKTSPTHTEIDARVTPKILQELGLKAPSFLKKELALKYAILEGVEGVQRFIEVDLAGNIDKTNPALSILNLEEIKGKFKAEIVQATDSAITLKNYHLTISPLSSKGNIILNPDYSIATINSQHTTFNNADFAFLYEDREDREVLELTGKKFDISNISLEKLIKKGSNSSKPFFLRSSLKKLGMYNGLVIDKPELMVECSPTLCTTVILRGKFENGHSFNMHYNYPDFSWYSDNAGNSLQALDIYTKMKGGLLSTTAKFAAEGGVTKGNIDISNYHLIKTPILAKLLSITAASSISFGGLADLIKGKGIGFKRLKCPIMYAHNLLILDECIQEGDVMTMTAKGTLNLAANTMDITGIVAPVNFINSISRRLPILRQFSGGDKGGFLAMNYTMKGEFKNDPKIYVNPLSILAPGFLKGLGNRKK